MSIEFFRILLATVIICNLIVLSANDNLEILFSVPERSKLTDGSSRNLIKQYKRKKTNDE